MTPAWKDGSPVGQQRYSLVGFFSPSGPTKEFSTVAEGVLNKRWYFFSGVHFEAGMSRRSIALLVGLYFVVALALSTFRVVSNPFFAGLSAAAVGQMVAGALLLLILAGLPALLIWVFFRFRHNHALWPMLSWAIIGIALALFTEVGVRLERDVQVSMLAKNLAVSDTKLSCIDSQHASRFRGEIGITDREISIFCGCVSEATAASATPDDLTYIATNGKAPQPMQERAVELGRPCNRLVGKK